MMEQRVIFSVVLCATAACAIAPAVGSRLLETTHADSMLRMSAYSLFYIFALPYAFWVTVQRFKHLKSWLLVFALVVFGVSIFLSGNIRPMMVIAPVFCILIFTALRSGESNFGPVFLLLSCLTVAPVALVVLWPSSEWYQSESFRGILSSRTDSSYYIGIVILLGLTSRSPLAWAIAVVAGVALLLTFSRGAILAVGLSVFCFWTLEVRRSKDWRLIVPGVAVLAIAGGLLFFKVLPSVPLYQGQIEQAIREGRAAEPLEMRQLPLTDSGNRYALFAAAGAKIAESPWFGAGDFYQHIVIGGKKIEAHNSLLQSSLNFGIPAALMWFLLLASFLYRLPPIGKTFVVFYMVFGLFQPGYDAFLMTPEALLPLLLAAMAPVAPWQILNKAYPAKGMTLDGSTR